MKYFAVSMTPCIAKFTRVFVPWWSSSTLVEIEHWLGV